MDFPQFLAMTGQEIEKYSPPAGRVGYLACHFSPYGRGLTGIPQTLPPGSLLVLTDRTPVWDHDPRRIAGELTQAVEGLGCAGVLLDLQRPGEPRTAAIARAVTEALPCPTAVTPAYARDLGCPVLAPPPAPWEPPQALRDRWPDRTLWLEAIPQQGHFVLDAAKSRWESLWEPGPEHLAHTCCTQVRVTRDGEGLRVYLRRGRLELAALAKALDIQVSVGLQQDFGTETEN